MEAYSLGSMSSSNNPTQDTSGDELLNSLGKMPNGVGEGGGLRPDRGRRCRAVSN